MGTIKVIIPDEVEHAFRKLAMHRFGYHKGSMSVAAKEAIVHWTSLHGEPEQERESLLSFAGLMEHIKKDSVKLQHEAWEQIKQKHANRR